MMLSESISEMATKLLLPFADGSALYGLGLSIVLFLPKRRPRFTVDKPPDDTEEEQVDVGGDVTFCFGTDSSESEIGA